MMRTEITIMRLPALIAITLVASSAFATDIITRFGTVYSDAEVRRVEPDGITIKLPTGLVKIPVWELSDKDRTLYNLSPESAQAYAAGKRTAQEDYLRRVVAHQSEMDALAMAKEAEKELVVRKELKKKAKLFVLRCQFTSGGKVHAKSPTTGVNYIVYGKNYTPGTYFYVYAINVGRVDTGLAKFAYKLIPVDGP